MQTALGTANLRTVAPDSAVASLATVKPKYNDVSNIKRWDICCELVRTELVLAGRLEVVS